MLGAYKFHQNYIILLESPQLMFKNPEGHWGTALGNSFIVDSELLFPNLTNMNFAREPFIFHLKLPPGASFWRFHLPPEASTLAFTFQLDLLSSTWTLHLKPPPFAEPDACNCHLSPNVFYILSVPAEILHRIYHLKCFSQKSEQMVEI